MRKHPVSIALSNRVLEKIDKEVSKQNVQEASSSSCFLKKLFQLSKTLVSVRIFVEVFTI